MIHRPKHLDQVGRLLRDAPVVAILGARQVGKTTLAGELAREWSGASTRFDLEDPTDLERLADPKLALSRLTGLVVIDEVQRAPGIFPVLRVLVDRPGSTARFLLLGSASPKLARQGGESLAGRIAYHELGGLHLSEVGAASAERLWLRGGFPRSFLAADDAASEAWRRDFVRTFLERDLPQLGHFASATAVRRFWTMLAHSHGQLWNASRIGASLGVAHTTVRSYLDALADALVIRQLEPCLANAGKRPVKTHKVYLRDSGVLHSLLRVSDLEGLLGHPIVGASWEGFALEQVVRTVDASSEECSFWASHGGAELDLIVEKGGRRLGFEFKRTSAPRATRSMRIALENLELDSIAVVYPGDQEFALSDKIRAVPLASLAARRGT